MTWWCVRAVCVEALTECQNEAEEDEARARATASLLKRRAEAAVADAICAETVLDLAKDVAGQQIRSVHPLAVVNIFRVCGTIVVVVSST